MPSLENDAHNSPLSGKKKSDLIKIAELTGLIEPGSGIKLTIPQLKAMIENGVPAKPDNVVSAQAPRRGRKRKELVVSEQAAVKESLPAPELAATEAVSVFEAVPEIPAPATEPEKSPVIEEPAVSTPVSEPKADAGTSTTTDNPPAMSGQRRRGRPKKSEASVSVPKELATEQPSAPIMAEAAHIVPADRTAFVQPRPDEVKRNHRPQARKTEIIPLTHADQSAPAAVAEPARSHTPHVRRGDHHAVRPIQPDKTHHNLTTKPFHAVPGDSSAVDGSATVAPAAVAAASSENTPNATEESHVRRPQPEHQEILQGVLEIMPDGYGFLRKDNYLQGSKDVYVPPQYIRRFGLREGDLVAGPGKPPRENDRYPAILYIKEVNGMPPERMVRRPAFDKLTPIYPDERFSLETARNELSTRIIDLVAPIGKGQRGMIVSPPKAGKTILLQKIANAISVNNPEVKLIVLLIDERPEEVTDMQRTINGEVVYSTFDKTPENHVKVTELVLERAMRLVELKQDVVILLDSMTRLSRAYNLTINPTGRTLSGGLDPGALYGPKRFFGSARNIENGGSLTIIATSLIETGSRMDEVIFEEFKGTGNMEVYLDRKLSEKRIFPAIDINKSGTRREELLLDSRELDAVWTIRKAFSQLDTAAVTEMIINLLLKTKDNDQFVSSINISLNDKNLFEAMRGQTSSSTGRNGNYASSGYGGSAYSGPPRKEVEEA